MRIVWTPKALRKVKAAMGTFPNVEVGGYLVVVPADRDLKVVDVIAPKQKGIYASSDLDQADAARLFDAWIQAKWEPWQVSCVWWHCHPGDDVTPTGKDEQTWREFGPKAALTAMVITGRENAQFTRVRVRATPLPFSSETEGRGVQEVRLSTPFDGWTAEEEAEWVEYLKAVVTTTAVSTRDDQREFGFFRDKYEKAEWVRGVEREKGMKLDTPAGRWVKRETGLWYLEGETTEADLADMKLLGMGGVK